MSNNINLSNGSIGSSSSGSVNNSVQIDVNQNSGSVQYNMSRSLAMTAQQAQDCRPETTKRVYNAKAKEFLEWAARTFVHESELERGIVSGEKLNFFLHEEVMNRTSRSKSKSSAPPKKVKVSTLEQYIAAITDLYKMQVQKKINCNEHPRATAVSLIKNAKQQEFQVRRQNCEDRGERTLADGYTSLDQVAKVVQFYLNNSRNHGENSRDSLAFLFSHYFLLRGESIRNAELTNFQTFNLDNESARPDIACPASVMVLKQGKTNKNNRLELTGCIRSTRVEICPIMSLGLYLFWRFHVQNEPFPDFTHSTNWYFIKLFKSDNSDVTKSWSYTSHRDAVSRGLDGAQIFTKKKTHINRGSAARMADLAGVNEDQIRRLGRWNNTTMNGAYLTGLPREVMRVMAGFTTQQGQFFLPRAILDPPEELCKKIFPELDAWNDRLTAKHLHPENEDQIEVTVAAKAFFDLMFMLRKTIIQDSILMMEKFPNHPLWQNDFFSNQMFLEYKQLMTESMIENSDPANALLQRCVPILEEKIKCMHQDISARLNSQIETQSKTNDYITRLVTGQATISLSINLPAPNGQQQDPQHISTTSIPQPFASQHEDLSSNTNSLSLPIDSNNGNQTPTTNDTVPNYQMSRGIASITDLWREWNEGLCGGYAVIDLERRWGTKWRKNEKEKKFFNRRKIIISTIEKYAIDHNISQQTAVDIAERRRSQKGYSLHWLANNRNEIFETSGI